MKFLSYDSKVSQILIRFSWACWLNLLWAVCSLPVFTMGAATTALYYATLRIAREEDGNVTAMFFKSFRQNFRQATALWLIMLGAGLFLAADGYVLYHLRLVSEGAMGVVWTILLAAVIAAAVFYTILLIWLFPLLASVENTNREMLKNAFLIGVHYLFATIVVAAIHFAVFFVTVRFFTPALLLGEGLCAMLSSIFMWRVIDACAGTPEDGGGEDEG